jgi:hypothetical protein
MRAKEFIHEGAKGFSKRKSDTMVTTYAFPGLPSNNPYLAYRFAMAMANHEIKDQVGPTNEYAVISAYTTGEEEIINKAAAQTNNKKVVVADRGSKEPNSTYKTSPVARVKKNKYGV